MSAARSAVSRRAVLGGLGGVALGGCTRDEPRAAPSPSPDVAVLASAIAGEEGLVGLYEAALRAHADLAGRLAPVLARHREHLTVLRRHRVPGTVASSAAATPPVVTPPAVPPSAEEALELLARTEREAAAARAEDVRRVAPAMAQLLASIGACEAGHAALLAEDGR
ncbi:MULTISPECIES: hypothetical protein [Thermomonospora]|uniref:Ferritin-like domain-containing protein n=1 Tax=Thermomonospora cellulosilytica TaxID=1411118 RepID=A0A7W3N3R3_9ACTN|nr:MULTISPECIES: hypothetical protein [Thermomonospora]MBA9006999.1 hypothetical protein [Thermomonospora cellulosilytica]